MTHFYFFSPPESINFPRKQSRLHPLKINSHRLLRIKRKDGKRRRAGAKEKETGVFSFSSLQKMTAKSGQNRKHNRKVVCQVELPPGIPSRRLTPPHADSRRLMPAHAGSCSAELAQNEGLKIKSIKLIKFKRTALGEIECYYFSNLCV